MRPFVDYPAIFPLLANGQLSISDLMRHSHPKSELGPIVERALDLLIESLMQRRFGKRASPKATTVAGAKHMQPIEAANVAHPVQHDDDTVAHRTIGPADLPLSAPARHDDRQIPAGAAGSGNDPSTARPDDGSPSRDISASNAPRTACYVPRSARRIVIERDGLGCSWVDEHGARCGAQAWLEYDHRRPRAKGGGSEPDNLRPLRRSHNQLAAEQEYGRRHVEQAIAERRRERSRRASPAI